MGEVSFSGRARTGGVVEEDSGAGRRAMAEGRERCPFCIQNFVLRSCMAPQTNLGGLET